MKWVFIPAAGLAVGRRGAGARTSSCFMMMILVQRTPEQIVRSRHPVLLVASFPKSTNEFSPFDGPQPPNRCSLKVPEAEKRPPKHSESCPRRRIKARQNGGPDENRKLSRSSADDSALKGSGDVNETTLSLPLALLSLLWGYLH